MLARETKEVPLSAHSIVVVGGSPHRREELECALDHNGWTVAPVSSVVEARSLLRRDTPDTIVVVDEMLDDSLTEALLDLRPLTAAPLIVLTEARDPATTAVVLQIGADDVQHVTLPVEGRVARFEAIFRRRPDLWKHT